MKRILLTLFLFFTVGLFSGATTEQNPTFMYQDWGNQYFPSGFDETYTSFDLYITVREIYNETQTTYNNYQYRYEIVGVSKSAYNGYLKNTWMNGAYVYINGIQQNSYGYTFNIVKEPTLLYYYETNDPAPQFSMTWETSYYDPRN